MGRKSAFNTPELAQVVAESKSYSDVMRKLGRAPTGGNFTTLRNHIAQQGLSTAHFDPAHYAIAYTGRKGRPKFRELDTIFCANSTATRSCARRALIRLQLIPYVCAHCANPGVWQGQPLTLDLDHINGVFNDHRLENLRWLCPNCHGQTATHCRRKT